MKGAGSAAWLIAQLPAEYGAEVRAKLAASLRASLDALGELDLGQEQRDAVLQKTGSLAWSASLRPEPEHDRLGEVLLETLLATRDPAQAGTLAWGLGNLKGLSDGARIETARSLLDALDETDDALREQYLGTLHRLAVEHPAGPGLDEIVRVIEEARVLRGADAELALRLDRLLDELRAHEEQENR